MSRSVRMRNAIAGIAIAVLPVAACSDNEGVGDADVIEQPGVGADGEGGAAQESLEARIGQYVELTGGVAEVISPNAFSLGGDEIGEKPVLVVGAEVPTDVTEGERIQVSGTVKLFHVSQFEEELNLDLVDREFEDFESDPAIQADSVINA